MKLLLGFAVVICNTLFIVLLMKWRISRLRKEHLRLYRGLYKQDHAGKNKILNVDATSWQAVHPSELAREVSERIESLN